MKMLDKHLVSSVIVNNVRGSSFYQRMLIYVNNDRWQGEIVDRGRINLSNKNVSEDYLTTFILAEDNIVIRYIPDYDHPHNGVQ